MNCAKCRLVVTDGVNCSVCKGILHYGCAGIAETTYRKMTSDKKANWRCVSCRAGNNLATDVVPAETQHPQDPSSAPAASGASSAELQQGFASILKEIHDFRDEFRLIKTDLVTCKDGIQEINTKLNEMESRVSFVEDSVSQMKEKTELVAKLQSDLNTATKMITTLQQEFDAREQYSRINNIEISGLPFKKGENLNSILHDMYTVVGLTFEAHHIDSIQRVRRFQTADDNEGGDNDRGRSSKNREPAVIVKFTRRIYKDQLLSAVRARKGITTSSIGLNGPALNLYLGDHLTPASKMLLKRARDLKRDNKLAYLWIRDCKILARKTETSKVMVINNNFDFNKIK